METLSFLPLSILPCRNSRTSRTRVQGWLGFNFKVTTYKILSLYLTSLFLPCLSDICIWFSCDSSLRLSPLRKLLQYNRLQRSAWVYKNALWTCVNKDQRHVSTRPRGCGKDKIVDRFIITITFQIITRVMEVIRDPVSACFRNNVKVEKARKT